MKYLYTVKALREIDTRTDTEVSASFIHKRGDLTDAGAARIAKRDELLDKSDRLSHVECACYVS
jgi:hypothetical protein